MNETSASNQHKQKQSRQADMARLRHGVKRAAAAINMRRMEMDELGQENQPLYVLSSDAHRDAINNLSHILLCESMKPSGYKTLIGYEQPHDVLTRIYNEASAYHTDAALSEAINALDPNGLSSLKMQFYKQQYNSAYYAKKTLYHYFIEQVENHENVSFTLNDASYNRDEILDPADPDTLNALRAAGHNEKDQILARSPEGVKVRNYFMTQHLQNKTKNYQPDLILQFCGAAHINGGALDGRIYGSAHGLAQHLKNKGAEIMVVAYDAEPFTVPDDALAPNEIIHINMPSSPETAYDPGFRLGNRSINNFSVDMGFMRRKITNKVLDCHYTAHQLCEMHLSDHALSLQKYAAFKEQYEQQVDMFFNELKNRALPKLRA